MLLVGGSCLRYLPPVHISTQSVRQLMRMQSYSLRRATALLAAAATTAAATWGRSRSKLRRVGRRRGSRSLRTTAASAASLQQRVAALLSPTRASLLLLVVVAALYGSLGICIRALYALPGPPTPACLSLVRQALTVAVFVPLLRSSGGTSVMSIGTLPTGFWVIATELAFWDLGAQGLMNVGLLFTSATRASFFAQLSVVITPLLACLAGQSVPSATWCGCIVALAGMLLLGADGAEPGGASASLLSGFNLGDLLCCGAALAWSAYIFRLTTISRLQMPSVMLQAAKTSLLAVFYLAWVLVEWLLVRECALADLWPGWASPMAWGILLFSAVGPGALGDCWMQQASDRVSPATANIVLSTEPLFAALFGGIFLGERLGSLGLMGGACIFCAAMVAGFAVQGTDNDDVEHAEKASVGQA